MWWIIVLLELGNLPITIWWLLRGNSCCARVLLLLSTSAHTIFASINSARIRATNYVHKLYPVGPGHSLTITPCLIYHLQPMYLGATLFPQICEEQAHPTWGCFIHTILYLTITAPWHDIPMTLQKADPSYFRLSTSSNIRGCQHMRCGQYDNWGLQTNYCWHHPLILRNNYTT